MTTFFLCLLAGALSALLMVALDDNIWPDA